MPRAEVFHASCPQGSKGGLPPRPADTLARAWHPEPAGLLEEEGGILARYGYCRIGSVSFPSSRSDS